ncbi:response regulator [bacterium]|jgi:CheY-like chemotaxis protein|nr:response regulator [bacterium]
MLKNKDILLIEDDSIDSMSFKRALSELGIKNKVRHVENGEEGLAYLSNIENSRPGIIFMDINMPRMTGPEFLKIALEKNLVSYIPVVVLTTSREEKDKTECFDLGVSGYMIKDIHFKDFVITMKTIFDYWTLCDFPGL